MTPSPEHVHAQSYRPDIDGLRAIAVMTVILFHAGFTWMQGGYVGVDVFFVISGYLITRKLAEEYKRSGKISFKKFYTSRIRRLFPALFVTILFTSIAAYFLLWPDALLDFAKSMIAAIVSVSNIYFWTEAGYWDTAAHIKPALHTWSLSVEEQFYLIWPLLILLISTKLSRRSQAFVLIALTVASLIAAELMVRHDPAMAFYFTPFRVYEFAIGGLCYFVKTPEKLIRGIFSELLGFAGFAAIIWASIYYNAETLFPGVTALVPCLGAAAIILTKGSAFNKFVLANGAMVKTGLISYSLYLVHWPIFVFYKIYKGSDFNLVEQIVLIVATFLAAYLLYQFIEKPFRKSKRTSESRPTSGAFVGLIAVSCAYVMTLVGTFVIAQQGLPGRYSNEFAALANKSKSDIGSLRYESAIRRCGKNRRTCGVVKRGKKNILILGDSHGVDGLTIMESVYPKANFLLSIAGGCPPFQDLETVTYSNQRCPNLNKQRFKWIYGLDIKPEIVLSIRLSEKRIPNVEILVRELTQRDFKVTVLGAGPHYKNDALGIVLGHASLAGLDSKLSSNMLEGTHDIDDILAPKIKKLGANYVRKLDYLCPEKKCKALTKTGDLFVFDLHHMTYEGAKELGEHYKQQSLLPL